ncbi:MAG: phosphoribosylformylglycinamidine synthase subunit PurS [Gemmatimonadetes bacterium]|nr:phosphoribosylformylglycinamidine synthase subunit PurS [Gemmatimonadota bacterium]
MNARVEVFVQLKPGMLDPQGETLERALESMGYEGVSGMRVGKWITFAVEGGERAEIEGRVDEMCRRLLANPVIETYRYGLAEAGLEETAADGGEEAR